MSFPDPKTGLVINYSYLWKSEADQGREEGTKNRPCMIFEVRPVGQDRLVTVHPITHTPPGKPVDGVEIPAATKARLGLDSQRSWVVTTEANRFVWPGPDLTPVSRKDPKNFAHGILPGNIIRETIDKVLEHSRGREAAVVSRDDAVSTDRGRKGQQRSGQSKTDPDKNRSR